MDELPWNPGAIYMIMIGIDTQKWQLSQIRLGQRIRSGSPCGLTGCPVAGLEKVLGGLTA
jgi:hypothetical protein